jgi:hypothetical protein
MEMSRINPEDELLKIRIRRYALRHHLPLPDLSVSVSRDRFQQQPQNIKVSDLQPLKIGSHDYKTLLEKLGPSHPVPAIARVVPEDKIYLGFKNFKNLSRFIGLWDTFAVPSINYFIPSLYLRDLKELLDNTLGLSEKTRAEWEGMEEIALLFGDFYLHEEADITLIIQFVHEEAMKVAWETLSKETGDPTNLLQETFSQTSPARRFIGSFGRYLIFSNHRPTMEKIQNGEGKKLTDAEDFIYVYNLTPLSEGGFFFIGEGFIRKWTSPAFKIEDLRRHRCLLTLEDLQKVLIFSSTEGATVSELTDFSKLAIDGYLPYLPLCPDEGKYHPNETDHGFACSIHGSLDSLNPPDVLSVDRITQAELREYEQFRTQYEGYFTRFIRPIGIGIELGDDLLRLSTVALSVVDEPLYTNLVQATVRGVQGSSGNRLTHPGGFSIFNSLTPDYGIAIALRSTLLQNVLNQDWFWRTNPTYFDRKIRPYLEGESIFGNELAVGLFDMDFSDGFPKNLKKLAQAPTELPLVLIQDLEKEENASKYLQTLFRLAVTESYKGVEIKRIPITGRLNLYGSVIRKLFVLSTSSEVIKHIIEFPKVSQIQNPFAAPMPDVDLRTEIHFDKILRLQPYLFQRMIDQTKGLCKKNLVTLQNLLELSGSPKPDLSDAEILQNIFKFGNIKHPVTCPEGGRYYTEENRVYCSIHHSWENYVENSELTERFPLSPLFAKLKNLTVQLAFMNEGILSDIHLFFEHSH